MLFREDHQTDGRTGSNRRNTMPVRRFETLLRRTVIAWMAFLILIPVAYGQSASWGRLVGTITDQSGAVIPGVEVTAVNKETNIASKTLTNERGDYIIDNVRPGIYDVSAEQPGFKKQLFAD